jgi:hypothetical protein
MSETYLKPAYFITLLPCESEQVLSWHKTFAKTLRGAKRVLAKETYLPKPRMECVGYRQPNGDIVLVAKRRSDQSWPVVPERDFYA